MSGDALRAMMERRYEAYKTHVVRPFFREHIARLDRQIVLIDSPNILGRDRWINNDVMTTAANLLSRSVTRNAQQKELIIRMALGAMGPLP